MTDSTTCKKDQCTIVADRWMRARRALKAEDQAYAERLSLMIRTHAGTRLPVLHDPLETALFALLIELLKEQDQGVLHEKYGFPGSD